MRTKFIFPIAILAILAACGTNTENNTTTQTGPIAEEMPPPPIIGYRLINEYPHDGGAFTQGLIWYKNHLLEGTGQFGESNVRHVDLATGKVLKTTTNKPEIFGEGITVLGGKLYQITWQNKVGYVYDAETLKLEKEFALPTAEGWGLTTNGQSIILSDGSSNLYFLDPVTLKETQRIGVFDNMGPKLFLNELEYIDGFVYANIWQSDYIVKIDPASGKIVGRIDFSDLRGKAGIPAPNGEEGKPEVFNGIAYDSVGKRLFVTGKYWPKLLEVKLDK